MAKKSLFKVNKKIKGFIFDTTGVLTDFGCVYHTTAIINVFKMRNIDIKENLIRKFNGLSLDLQLKKLIADKGVLKDWKKLYGNKPNDEDIQKLFQDLIKEIASYITYDDYVITSFIKRYNKLTDKGYNIALTSEYPAELAKPIFEKLYDAGFKFNHTVTIDETKVGAPYPWMCYLAAIKLNVFPLTALVRIGDTLYNIEEGLNANMWTVGVVNSGNLIGLMKNEIKEKGINKLNKKLKNAYKKFKKKGAHYIIDSINDLQWLVDDINASLQKCKRV